MLLNPENICHYLLQKGLIPAETVVNGDLSVLASPTRNNVFRVTCNGGRSLFVKQTFTFGPAETGILRREADSLHFISSNPAYEGLKRHVPDRLCYDPQQHVLVTEYHRNTWSSHEYYMQRQAFPEAPARAQAEVLASYHFPVPAGTDTSVFPHAQPWILRLSDFGAYEFFPQSRANGQLISVIQSRPDLKALLTALRDDWTPSSLVHGDVKWINFIMPRSQEEGTQYLVDWELGDIGDPCWDTAGILQSYMTAWAFSFDNQQPGSRRLSAHMQAFDPGKMHGALRAFWQHYTACLPPIADAEALLLKTVRFCAARMIQTAIEGVVYTPVIEPNNMRSIQIAHNILKDPALAAEKLLGITRPRYA